MFRFANPEYLYFLIAVPIVVLLFCWSLYARRKKLRTIGDIELLKGLMPDVSIRWFHIYTCNIFLCFKEKACYSHETAW